MIDANKLKDLLPDRRWFGAQDRAIADVEILDSGALDEGSPRLVMALVRVRFTDAPPALYNLPLLVHDDGSVGDALDDVERLRVLGQHMASGFTVRSDTGAFHFGGAGLDPMAPPGRETIRVLDAEQSNSSVVLDESVIVKLFRRVEPGANPDLELGRLLTNEGFEHIPPQVGELWYEGESQEPDDGDVYIDLGIAQQFLDDAREGWNVMLEHVRSLYEGADDSSDVRAEVAARAEDTFTLLDKLGEATAALHVVLSREEMDPDLAPEPADVQDVKEWTESARSWLRRLTDDGIDEISPLSVEIESRLDRLTGVGDAGLKLRIHGDFHLGQVVLSHRRWMILDFEGEPLRSIETRRRKHSPLKDIAGMLRSLNYAAAAMLFERTNPDADDWPRLSAWATAWEELARKRFLAAYRTGSHEGSFLPADDADFWRLLDFFEIEKALYELAYEKAHRPHWLRIPLQGIENVLTRKRPE